MLSRVNVATTEQAVRSPSSSKSLFEPDHGPRPKEEGMESRQDLVLVTGVTGKQGGAIARELVEKGVRVRGMTRHPESDAARAMQELGVEIVAGDFDDEASVRRALAGAWGAYSVQNTWEVGVEREEEQGKRFARLARE